MGSLGSILGGGTKTSKSSSSTSSWLDIPQNVLDPLNNLVDQYGELALAPYTPYTGQRFSGFNPDQLSMFQGVRDLQGQYSPIMQQLLSSASNMGQGIDANSISQFINPYQQNVTDIAKREAMRGFDTQMNTIGDQALAAGAFGGDRHGVVEGEAYRNLNQSLNDIQMTGSQQGYNQATQTALANAGLQQAGASTLAGVLGQAQGMDLAGLTALQQIGGQQQALDQSGLDFNYQQFSEGQQWPYTTSQWGLQGLGSLAQLLGTQQGTATQTQTQSSKMSPLQAAMGIGSMFAGGGMGSLFGSAMSGVGSMFGSGVFGNGLATAVNSFGRNPMMNGPYQTPNMFGRYSKGGSVKRYADGGSVRMSDYLQSLVDASQFKSDPKDNRLKRMGKNVANDLIGLTMVPTKALRDVHSVREGLGDWLLTPPEEVDTTDYNAEEMRQNYDMENVVLGTENPDQFGNIGASSLKRLFPELAEEEVSPEQTASNMLKSRMNAIASDLGASPVFGDPAEEDEEMPTEGAQPVLQPASETSLASFASQTEAPAARTAPKQKRWHDGLDLPTIAMGAAILKNPVDEPALASLGAGMGALAEFKQKQAEAEIAGSQANFENLIRMMNAQQFARQNELASRRFMFEEEMQPFEKAKTLVEIQKMKAEADAMQDPVKKQVADTILKTYENNPFVFSEPGSMTTKANELEAGLRQMQNVQGTGDTSLKRISYTAQGNRVE